MTEIEVAIRPIVPATSPEQWAWLQKRLDEARQSSLVVSHVYNTQVERKKP